MRNNPRKLLLNYIPIKFSSVSIRVGAQKYDSDPCFRGLVKTHRATHVICRQGSTILDIPISDGGKILGEETEIRIEDYPGLSARLVREALTRYFVTTGLKLRKARPIIFVNRSANLLRRACDKLNLSCPEWLYICLEYFFDVRIHYLPNEMRTIGLIANVSTTNIIDASCDLLLQKQIPIFGRYLQRKEEPDSDIFEDFLRIVGRVSSIIDDSVILEDARDELQSISTKDAYLEPRKENLELCLRTLFPERFSELIEALKAELLSVYGGEGKLDRLNKLEQRLNGMNPLAVCAGLSVTFGKMLDEDDSADFPRVEQSWGPTYVFDPSGSRTDTWHDRGLDKHGPYDRQNFTPESPKIAVICNSHHRGEVELFLKKLEEGLPQIQLRNDRRNPFAKGIKRKYQLRSCHFDFYEVENDSANAYKRKAQEAIEQASANNAPYHLALIQIRESFHQLFGNENPYYVTKAAFLTHQIPTQAVELETMAMPDNQLIYILNNLALACYAKMKGIPWVIRANQAIAHELVIGLGSSIVSSSRLAESKRVVGITTVFTGDGNYLLSNRTQEAEYENYVDALLQSLTDSINRVSKDFNWQPKDSVRLIFHIFKPFKGCEIEAIKKAVSDLGDYNVQFAFLHVVDRHPYCLLDLRQGGIKDYRTGNSKGVYAATRATSVRLEADTSAIFLTGYREIKTEDQGLPDPLLLRLHRDSSFRDMTYLTRQLYAFACNSWRSFLPSPLPVTILYSQLIAHQLGHLADIERWNSDCLFGELAFSRWFL